MRSYLYRWLFPSLASVVLISAVHTADADAKRRPPPSAYDDDAPNEGPPAPRHENHEATRAGFFWQAGHHEWKKGRGWEWIPGHWERERVGMRYRPVRWEKKGPRWVKIDGDYVKDEKVVIALHPTAAPPALRPEAVVSIKGKIWIKGHWVWKNGNWDWVAGRHENERVGERWVDSRWDNRGGKWEISEGRWERDPSAPIGPTSAPPPLRAEAVYSRPGQIWIKGHWQWKNGWDWVPGHHEAERRGERWVDSRVESRGGRWEVIEGRWERDPSAPVVLAWPKAGPPALRPEAVVSIRGRIWVKGHWAWKNGNWDWVAGHHENERAGERWRDARWEARGDRWEIIEGGWERDPSAPVVLAWPKAGPPALRPEAVVSIRGRIWVKGHWAWKNGNWDWVAGHHENERPGERWRDARWEARGDRWEIVEGGWEHDPSAVASYPTSAPPPPKGSTPPPRPGQVWLNGHWNWVGGNWIWVDGRWEKERPRQRWREARWENRGGRWELIAGDWEGVTVSPYPTSEPPPLRVETPPARAGMVFLKGRWDWKDGAWAWVDGRWETPRSGHRFVDGRWSRKGDRWEFSAGTWQQCGEFPGLDTPPPAPRPESLRPGPDQGLIPGRWRWVQAQCDFEWVNGGTPKAAPGMRYRPGVWIQRDGRYMWTNGDWEKDPGARAPDPYKTPPPPPPVGGPRTPPPPPQAETYGTKAGFIWAKGHHEWRTDRYEWIPGHWERAREKLTWQDARWEKQGDVWVFIAGGWR